MSLDSKQELDILYKEYTRLSNIAMEHYKMIYEDIKLFGAIGAAAILWKPLSDFIASSQKTIDSDSILLIGFVGLEILLGIISCLNLLKQANVWHFVRHLKAYEIRINQLLSETESSQLFHFYHDLESSKYINANYRTGFMFFGLYVQFALTFIPFTILFFVNLIYALIFLAFAAINTIILFTAGKRVFRYYPGKNLVGIKYVITHLLREGPID